MLCKVERQRFERQRRTRRTASRPSRNQPLSPALSPRAHQLQVRARDKEKDRQQVLTQVEEAMANIAMPYSAAVLPLSIHAVETEECLSRRLYFVCKRATDIFLAALLLPLLVPLMLMVALLIKADSPGPVIFVQKRIGVKRRIKGGRMTWELYTFSFYKFRSMVNESDPTPHQVYFENFRLGSVKGDQWTVFKLTNDSRLTRVGEILRRTSLDELPQLVNVLKGEMSLVGPRPALPYEVALYDEAHFERFRAMPGITGWWQATARSRVGFEEMIQMDIDYARRASFWFDLEILLLTIPAVLSCRGAE
jgi:lipopolysaccharide/colanic/teichoic acid biosynthesis glycosyltransferase